MGTNVTMEIPSATATTIQQYYNITVAFNKTSTSPRTTRSSSPDVHPDLITSTLPVLLYLLWN
ncbi:hypothetical protein PDJAM_G00050230 [Pangasius djambal]|uniref:Uncharacterized protein n=1 Tax=Pangasius djambal TaxID=1691987 RepID=A0ACC5YV27_9TELE|nr:hypothetical protein [Pangasius djambal]